MSLLTLPEEVLEMLFLYMEVQDILTVWEVVDFEGSDFFWRNLCEREGYKNTLKEESTWKTAFYRNINWATEKCVKREYVFCKNLIKRHSRIVKNILHGENLVINNKDEILVWNIDKYPLLIQKLSGDSLKVSGTKLLAHNEQKVKLYLHICNTYQEIFNLESSNYSCGSLHYSSLTDEHFAAFDRSLTSVKVVDFGKSDDFIIPFSAENGFPVSIGSLGYILYIMTYNGSNRVLKRYNLEKKEWLDDITLLQGVIYRKITLNVSSNLLVCWIDEPNVWAPVMVWKSNGEFFKSLSFEFINYFGAQDRMNPDGILWLIVESEYIIFSIDITNITIWNSSDPDICKQMYKDEQFYVGQTVISSHLLVLSYSCCFKVVDFKKAMYLYDVWFDKCHSSNASLSLYQEYFVNENFYVHLKEVYDPSTEAIRSYFGHKFVSSNPKKIHKSSESSQVKNKGCALWAFKTCTLTIYDFRSQQ